MKGVATWSIYSIYMHTSIEHNIYKTLSKFFSLQNLFNYTKMRNSTLLFWAFGVSKSFESCSFKDMGNLPKYQMFNQYS